MRENDTNLRPALEMLLNSNIGFCITLFDLLQIRQLESLEFAVSYEENGKAKEKIFLAIDQAIEFFVARRHQLKLGFDYEMKPN